MILSYTFLTIISVIAVVLLDTTILKTRVLAQKRFWIFYAIVVILQTIVDNYLNGRWGQGSFIVGNYSQYSGINILFTPLENYFFGFSLITLNIILFEKLTRTSHVS